MGRHHGHIFGFFYPSSLFCRVAMTLGQRTRAITTPPPYSHCQMCNSLGKDQDSLTSDPFPSGGRQEGRALQGGWEGSHTTCGHWQKTWECWVKQLYDWRQHTLHNHMGSLAFQAPGGDAEWHKWRPHSKESASPLRNSPVSDKGAVPRLLSCGLKEILSITLEADAAQISLTS